MDLTKLYVQKQKFKILEIGHRSLITQCLTAEFLLCRRLGQKVFDILTKYLARHSSLQEELYVEGPLFVFSTDDLKQNATSLLTPVSNTVFYALSSGTLGFALQLETSSLQH